MAGSTPPLGVHSVFLLLPGLGLPRGAHDSAWHCKCHLDTTVLALLRTVDGIVAFLVWTFRENFNFPSSYINLAFLYIFIHLFFYRFFFEAGRPAFPGRSPHFRCATFLPCTAYNLRIEVVYIDFQRLLYDSSKGFFARPSSCSIREPLKGDD